jgi:hypothetical protein
MKNPKETRGGLRPSNPGGAPLKGKSKRVPLNARIDTETMNVIDSIVSEKDCSKGEAIDLMARVFKG